jgi:iron complex outermembrane recepter protein
MSSHKPSNAIFRLKSIVVLSSLAFSHQSFCQAIKPSEPAEKSETNVQSTQLDSITVVGTKRNQKVQEAVQSISVFETQDTIGLQYGLDVLRLIPNITSQSSSFLPTVRGLDGNGIATGGGGAVSGARPRMSNYIDGVARSYSASPDGQGGLWDIKQIEVYKGSQSTQFGRNSMSGAIVQSTIDPKFKDEYAFQLGAHNEGITANAAVMANKQLGDQMAIRVTGEAIRGSNYINYADYIDSGLSAADRDELGKSRFKRFRLKALVAPTAFSDLKIKFTLDSEQSQDPYTKDSANSDTANLRKLTTRYGHYASKNLVGALQVTYDLNKEWTLDTTVSNQKSKTNFGPPVVGSSDPAGYLNFTFKVNETAIEPKLNYQSATSRTNGVVGLFYLTRDRTDLGLPGSLFELTAVDQSKTKSLFADATIELSKHLDLLVGARLERDQQKRDFSGFDGFFAFNFDAVSSVLLPKIGATFHVGTDQTLSLLTYKGYTASGGGVSFVSLTPYTFNKESAQTSEIVMRSQWLNNRLTANANFFYTRLKDLQVNAIGPGGPLDSVYANLKKANTYGAEFQLTYAPIKTTRAFLSVGLLRTKISDFGSEVNNSSNGNQLALSPKLTARLGGYSELIPKLTVGADVSFSGKRFSDYQNTKADLLPSYAIANVNVRYQLNNMTISAFANNIFNKSALGLNATSENYANVFAPRTVGANVSITF